MKYTLTGDNLQFVTMEIQPGEMVWAEAGALVYISGNINMEAKLQGGLLKGLKRTLAGESFMVTHFSSAGGPGLVSFGGNCPGKIAALDITGTEFIAQKDAFLCAEESVKWEMAFQKRLGSTFFGGEGLILQHLSGEGMVFLHAAGDLVEIDLKEGQTYKVSTAHVVGWEPTVSYDIEAAGGKVVADGCVVVAPMQELCYKALATNSAKMATYAPSHAGLQVRFGSLDACLRAALSGRWEPNR